jgi:pyruvate dehydrogenase E2 component (dihydrolipoamide acetyltransferase)
MIEFKMPSLGADMEQGTLVEWLKQPGDVIHKGDVLAVVETQKGAIEIEVFSNGVLRDYRASPGDHVPVGEVIAILDSGKTSVMPAVKPSFSPVPSHKPATAERLPGKPKITPAARRLAQQLGLDVSNIAADGSGVVGLRQVQAVSPETSPAEGGRAGIDFREMRKAIAAAMARSKREIPHYYVSSDIDVTALMDWLAQENASRPVADRLLYAVPLFRILARTLVDTPELNGHYEQDTFSPAQTVNAGIAIAMRGGGLVAPSIRDVAGKSIDDLRISLTDLVGRVRSGRLRSSELSNATVTFSNLGERTADTLMPIIYPPQVAIIGCGQIVSRPWVKDGEVHVRQIMSVTVAGDHRVSDGRSAARFLSRLEQRLTAPEDL